MLAQLLLAVFPRGRPDASFFLRRGPKRLFFFPNVRPLPSHPFVISLPTFFFSRADPPPSLMRPRWRLLWTRSGSLLAAARPFQPPNCSFSPFLKVGAGSLEPLHEPRFHHVHFPPRAFRTRVARWSLCFPLFSFFFERARGSCSFPLARQRRYVAGPFERDVTRTVPACRARCFFYIGDQPPRFSPQKSLFFFFFFFFLEQLG